MNKIFTFLLAAFAFCTVTHSAIAQVPDCDFCPDWYDYDDLESALKAQAGGTDVTNLDIAMQKLTAVDARIGQLKKLECLDLSFNRISTLPEEFAQLESLRCLKLTGTRYLSTIPEVLAKLPNLEFLDVRDHPEWKSGQLQKAKELLPNVTIIGD